MLYADGADEGAAGARRRCFRPNRWPPRARKVLADVFVNASYYDRVREYLTRECASSRRVRVCRAVTHTPLGFGVPVAGDRA